MSEAACPIAARWRISAGSPCPHRVALVEGRQARVPSTAAMTLSNTMPPPPWTLRRRYPPSPPMASGSGTAGVAGSPHADGLALRPGEAP